MRCRQCHRPLTDPVSVKLGIGPVCRSKDSGQIDMFQSNTPAYDYYIHERNGCSVLCIVDRYDPDSPTVTVTNGVDFVLKNIANEIGELPPTIIYRDTEGEWDRLKASADGTFLGFAPLAPGMVDRVTGIDAALDIVAPEVSTYRTFIEQVNPIH